MVDPRAGPPRGRVPQARGFERGDNSLNEALALAQQSGDVRGAAVVKANLGYNLLEDGEEEVRNRC